MGKHRLKGMMSVLHSHLHPCNLFLPVILLQVCSNLAAAGSIVKFLPGFDGQLPFELETGYIGVGESEDVQLFYYFIKSESNTEEDPLVLWLTGGPGCSGFSGLIYEIGPVKFEQVESNRSLPRLALNPYSWTKVANIIFLDLPVGTGFSYARTQKASHSSDRQAFHHAYEFIRKWLHIHPKYISHPFFVGGDSYSGITVPVVTELIANGNDVGIEPRIHLKGYLLGNPVTSPSDSNYRVQFAHGMALISDELYQSMKETCGGEYQDIDPSNVLCLENVEIFNQLLSGISPSYILRPHCAYSSPKPEQLLGGKRSVLSLFDLNIQEFKIRQVSASSCYLPDVYSLSNDWANDSSVQEALHVEKGTILEWRRCSKTLNYTKTIRDSRPYFAKLSAKGYRSLIYSGDHDLLVPFLATQAWIRSLNYTIVDDWRPWMVQGQVAGYTRTYANKMTFATVKGGGHTAPEFKPPECKAMFERWISSQPL